MAKRAYSQSDSPGTEWIFPVIVQSHSPEGATVYMFIVKRLRTPLATAVAVVTFANECVAGDKSAIIDCLVCREI